MHRSPLHSFHAGFGAKMVDFAGWEMPLTYFGVNEEHAQVRRAGGLFDVSHMGRVRFHGRHARRLLERLCTRRISDMKEGQCRYSFVCNEQGGVKDDVIVMRIDDDDFMVVVNASNRSKLMAHFEAVKAAGDLVLSIDDQTEKTAMVALQGPQVMDLVARVSSEVPTLKRFRFAVKNLIIAKLYVSRTGYTGEDGVEVILPAKAVDMALKLLLKDVALGEEGSSIRPAGLAARDTLRMEAGMPLYGQELSEEMSALSVGMPFAMNLDKADAEMGEAFVGMEALQQTSADGGPRRMLTGLKLDGPRSARTGHEVLVGDRPVGIVTSACPSPTLGCPIAMAMIEQEHRAEGTAVRVNTGRATLEGTVVPLPFYKAG